VANPTLRCTRSTQAVLIVFGLAAVTVVILWVCPGHVRPAAGVAVLFLARPAVLFLRRKGRLISPLFAVLSELTITYLALLAYCSFVFHAQDALMGLRADNGPLLMTAALAGAVPLRLVDKYLDAKHSLAQADRGPNT